MSTETPAERAARILVNDAMPARRPSIWERERAAPGARPFELTWRTNRPTIGFWESLAVEREVAKGEPRFPHTLHLAATLATAGVWGVVWWAHWRCSAARRYRERRTAILRANGVGI